MDNSPGNPTPISPAATIVGRMEITQRPLVIRFNVPAVPVAQPRPRAFVTGGSARMADVAMGHPVHDFKASVRAAFVAAYQGPPLAGPLRMSCVFLMPRPKSMIWKNRAMPRVPHICKPDLDNLLKGVLDCLNTIAFRDDAQIHDVDFTKWIASGQEQPHVEIEIIQGDR